MIFKLTLKNECQKIQINKNYHGWIVNKKWLTINLMEKNIEKVTQHQKIYNI